MKQSQQNMRWMGSILALACGLIIACGGAGIGDLASSGGGVGGTGISAGSVTAIGSVHVNGVHFDTTEAEIFVEDQSLGFGDPAVYSHLKVGMVVRVEGDIQSDVDGTARKVYFSDDLRGPIESIAMADDIPETIIVLGTTVVLLDSTMVDGLDLYAIAVDDWVQVSGFEDADGRIRASFISASNAVDKASLKGTITGLDMIQREFQINGITIDYQGAEFIGFTEPTESLRVKATGTLSGDNHRLSAERVERIDILGATDSEDVELEGIITHKASDTQLSLNGVHVVLDGLTEFRGGEPADLEVGLWMEMEGELIAGILYATKVIFKNDLKIEAPVNTNSGSAIIVSGLPNLIIEYDDAATKVTGAVDAPELIDHHHYVKVLGWRKGPGAIEAIHIIVNDTLGDTVKVQGPLENYADPFATVLNQEINLNTIPDGSFESPEGESVTREEFVDRITTQGTDFISVRGALAGPDAVIWLSISAE